jgi:hypothetical protein
MWDRDGPGDDIYFISNLSLTLPPLSRHGKAEPEIGHIYEVHNKANNLIIKVVKC